MMGHERGGYCGRGGVCVDLPLDGELGSRGVMLQLTRVTGRRERDVAMLAAGTPSQGIAAGMFRIHLRSAMRKIDAGSRTPALTIPDRLVEV